MYSGEGSLDMNGNPTQVLRCVLFVDRNIIVSQKKKISFTS